jgi:hypothetical protein
VAKQLARVLEDVYNAEAALAGELRRVGERHAGEPDVVHLTRMLAEQCDRHAEIARQLAVRYAHEIAESVTGSAVPEQAPTPGLSLLLDLRALYLLAEECAIDWTMLRQAAQAARDPELLDAATACHGDILVQIKWLTTRIKEAAPQALATG